jgi:hypothetical protein
MAQSKIPALRPSDGGGHNFVCYADCCSGVPGAPHEENFAAVNAVVARLEPPPDFICFPGDEVVGLTASDEELRRQWRHWFELEMAWLDRKRIPLYHTTGNHTAYDPASEAVFREVMAHLPDNGPAGQGRLSYAVRRGDLLMAFVNTTWSGLGGEGRVETEWLDRTLAENSDARFKLVFGHHPVHPVNGFSGTRQREIDHDDGRELWRILVNHGVLAYVCSHILAFDVQVHSGVLQILTAGAGTVPRMPEGVEYLHCVQAALDQDGLRYQVLDTTGAVREELAWPLRLPPAEEWKPFEPEDTSTDSGSGPAGDDAKARITTWRFRGHSASGTDGTPQTLLFAPSPGSALAPLWLGLRGAEQRLTVLLSARPGTSPHTWLGPELPPDEPFDFQLAIHDGMGPGGLLHREDDAAAWSSLRAASSWGAERLPRPTRWTIGHGQRGPSDQPFRGRKLRVAGQSSHAAVLS